MLDTGCILFVHGTSWISRLIQRVTNGPVNHVAILYDDCTVFETDGAWGKAKFFPLLKYKQRNILIYDGRFSEAEQDMIQAKCEEYEGAKYSYWDIAIRSCTFWLPEKLKDRIEAWCGTKHFMICNELVMRILYEATGRNEFAHYESSNPAELLTIIQALPQTYSRLV